MCIPEKNYVINSFVIGSITIKWSNFIPSMLSISTDSSNWVMNIDHDVLDRLGFNGDFAEKNIKIGPELAK